MFCVRQSFVRGCRFSLVFVYFIIKVFECSPVPTSFFPYLRTVTLVPKPERKEGGTCCQRALAAEGDHDAEEVGHQEEAETTSGCPRRWCWSNRRTGGTEGSLPCSWVEEGWLLSEREQRSRCRTPGGQSLLPSAMFGEEQGTGDLLPATLDRRSHCRSARRWRSVGPSTKDVQYHRMAPRLRASQLVEDQVESVSGNRTEMFFFLSPLSRLSLLTLQSSFLLPRLSLPPGTQWPPWRPTHSRAQSLEYHLACEGRESKGNGARPVEFMIMNDTCATHWSRVPRRSSGRIKGGAMTVEDKRGLGLDFILCFVCGSHPRGAAAFILCLFILLLKCLNVRRFLPPPSRIYKLCYNHHLWTFSNFCCSAYKKLLWVLF